MWAGFKWLFRALNDHWRVSNDHNARPNVFYYHMYYYQYWDTFFVVVKIWTVGLKFCSTVSFISAWSFVLIATPVNKVHVSGTTFKASIHVDEMWFDILTKSGWNNTILRIKKWSYKWHYHSKNFIFMLSPPLWGEGGHLDLLWFPVT